MSFFVVAGGYDLCHGGGASSLLAVGVLSFGMHWRLIGILDRRVYGAISCKKFFTMVKELARRRPL